MKEWYLFYLPYPTLQFSEEWVRGRKTWLESVEADMAEHEIDKRQCP